MLEMYLVIIVKCFDVNYYKKTTEFVFQHCAIKIFANAKSIANECVNANANSTEIAKVLKH